ncbi:MAG: DUF938 domain-containing protein [Pseudomonadota bacterium]
MTDQNTHAEGRKVALEDRVSEGDRLFSPSAARNRDAIRDAFLAHMPLEGAVLEIGAGTGEHGVHIAGAAKGLQWRLGDPDPASRRSIAAWIATSGLDNISGPHEIDVSTDDWDVDAYAPFAGLVSVNMIHIAPFTAAAGLFAGAGKHLRSDGKLFLYGPFSRDGRHIAPSNAAFDESLKTRDPRWGVRDLDRDIAPLAEKHGLVLDIVVEMPANNLSVIFARR